MTVIENSKAIKEIGVSGNDLLVKFTNGSTYSHVGAAVEYVKMLNADSVGLYYNMNVRNDYAFVRKN